MAKAKGPKMKEDLVRRRAAGAGFQTIAAALGIARNTVKARLKELGAYEISQAAELMKGPFKVPKAARSEPHWAGLLVWPEALKEVEGGTPIKEFWEGHVVGSQNPDLRGVPYETFWREFRRRHPTIDIHYHKTHEPGLRTEIDYKGDTHGLGYIDRSTGEFIDCRLFGQVLCNSQLFFAYATPDEKQGSWLAGIENGFAYFGGVTQILVVDNTRCAVNRSDWFDPDVNQEFYNFCCHFKTTVIPARPKRPKDKNLIEVSLGVFWRWIRRRLRQRQFFSPGELNRYLHEACDEFNRRYQKKYGCSRRDRFKNAESITLKPLPTGVYEAGEWQTSKLHEDCHIQVRYNFYSAPYQHRGKELAVRITTNNIEIFFEQERLAIHPKRPDHQRGNYTTEKAHLPEKFRAMEEFGVTRQIHEAKKVGPHTEKIITNLLTQVSHPLMFLRRTMGILRFKGKYGAGKLERACEILLGLGFEKPSTRDVEKILKGPSLTDQPQALTIVRKANPHLRGQMSFNLEGVQNEHSTKPDRPIFDGTTS